MGTGEPLEQTSEVILIPDAEHCVETMARREFRRCVDACLQSPAVDPNLAAQFETLRRFLEQADFRRLRRESETLVSAGLPVRFVLSLDGDRVACRMTMDEEKPR